MMSWPVRKVGDFCKVGRGSSPRPISNSAYFDGGTIPWIKVADATASGKFLHNTKQRVNDYGASFSRLLAPGSLIICTSGTLGHPSVLGVEGCIHDGWLYTYDYDGLDKDFFYYFLVSSKEYFFSVAYGAAIQNINTEILRNTPISLPPLPTQKRIASVLSAYDDLIENNRRRIALLEEAARLLYREWFIHFRFPGHEHVKIIEGVPEGWEQTNLGKVATTNPESHKKGKLPERLNYIDISSVSRGRIDYKTEMSSVDAPGRARRVARHGDTIWSNVRPNLRAYSIVQNPAKNDVFSTGFTVLHADKIKPYYLYFFATSDAFVDHLVNHATGTSYPAVRPEDFEKAEILVPTEELKDSFEEFCEPLFRQIELLNSESEECAKARDLLLPRLMGGRLEV